MNWETLVIVIYLAGMTINLSHLIFLVVAYHSEEVLLIHDYDLEKNLEYNCREKKIKIGASSNSTRSVETTWPRSTLPATTKVLDELSGRTPTFVVCLRLVLTIFHRQSWAILVLQTYLKSLSLLTLSDVRRKRQVTNTMAIFLKSSPAVFLY